MNRLFEFFSNENIVLSDIYKSKDFLIDLKNVILEFSLIDDNDSYFVIDTIYETCGLSFENKNKIDFSIIPICLVNFKLAVIAHFHFYDKSKFIDLIDEIDLNLLNNFSKNYIS